MFRDNSKSMGRDHCVADYKNAATSSIFKNVAKVYIILLNERSNENDTNK